ncbi:sensor histidine kinase [Paludibacterium paludis]|uniref:histidine kinase n=1 Tax=Paludibacterium paludis TaxID=1225769 RepID=A0A918P2B4_9NEIS|nr:ATP-binding protein [Paludibacterium paludis]GGY13929.1 hypothetical protein GCM10011289_16610 [Paludibacterium paludis]
MHGSRQCGIEYEAGFGQLVAANEEIARRLHDELAQRLVFALIHLDDARAGANDPAPLAHCRGLVREALGATRELIGQLQGENPGGRMPNADDFAERCESVAREVGTMAGKIIGTDCPAVRISLPEPVARLLLDAARELLVNACKHAPEARIALRLRERRGGIELTVRDDGPGFDPQRILAPRAGGSGLCRLPARLRAEGIGLTLRTEKGAGAGVCAELVWPSMPGSRS